LLEIYKNKDKVYIIDGFQAITSNNGDTRVSILGRDGRANEIEIEVKEQVKANRGI